jgi:hypothetical protein
MHNLKTIFLISFLSIFYLSCFAGEKPPKEDKAVKASIEQFFNGMRAGDSSMVSAVLHAKIRMQTVEVIEGETNLRNGSAKKFLNAVGTPHDVIWDERILSYDIKVDGAMATAWTAYAFYAGDTFSHCGVNAFQFFKDDEKGWLITQIIDTRRKEDCKK